MFDPDRFWEFSQELLQKGNALDECGARIAAGRAYYAFFLTAKLRLQGRGVRQER